MTVDYEKRHYWHDRFAQEESFEWLITSSQFMAILEPDLQSLPASDTAILHLGFGTSDLQNHLRARGFRNVTNVDYEPLAIQRGIDSERKVFGHVEMRYAVADATDLESMRWSPEGAEGHGDRESSYGLVIDKSTADAVSCAGEEALRKMAQAIHKRLAPGGFWISMSYSSHRFDVAGLPFDVQVLSRVAASKARPTDPDIYHWCYKLRPRSAVSHTP